MKMCPLHVIQVKVAVSDREVVMAAVFKSCVSYSTLLLTDWLDTPDMEVST